MLKILLKALIQNLLITVRGLSLAVMICVSLSTGLAFLLFRFSLCG